MKNQNFPWIIKVALAPLAIPYVLWAETQSDMDVCEEIEHFQGVERGREHPYQEFIDLDPREILWEDGVPNAHWLVREMVREVIPMKDLPTIPLRSEEALGHV